MNRIEVYKFTTPVASDKVGEVKREIKPEVLELPKNRVVPVFAPLLEASCYTVQDTQKGLVIGRNEAQFIQRPEDEEPVERSGYVADKSPLKTLKPGEFIYMLADSEPTKPPQRFPDLVRMTVGAICYVRDFEGSGPPVSSSEPLGQVTHEGKEIFGRNL